METFKALRANSRRMSQMNAADTGFVLISAMLVMLMVPALALFYGGLVASRNVLSTTMHSFVLLGVGAFIWPLIGYTLAFGPTSTV